MLQCKRKDRKEWKVVEQRESRRGRGKHMVK